MANSHSWASRVCRTLLASFSVYPNVPAVKLPPFQFRLASKPIFQTAINAYLTGKSACRWCRRDGPISLLIGQCHTFVRCLRRIDRLASFELYIHLKIVVSPHFKISCAFLVRWDVSAGDSCAGELLRFPNVYTWHGPNVPEKLPTQIQCNRYYLHCFPDVVPRYSKQIPD